MNFKPNISKRNVNSYLHSTSCFVDWNTVLKFRRKCVFGIGWKRERDSREFDFRKKGLP